MDLSLERDSSMFGSLFNQIITDMKNTSPLWEDFIAKAGKLHACLRAAIQAIAAYLDAFQKIADAATNSRGATKEIGTALTRVCLRHKAVETRLKTFTNAIMDCLVLPLQDKVEDWKRSVATIDKEHAKEHKRCRAELKKRSSDTLRLQKKARKGQSDTIQSLVDSHMQDVTLRRAELEEVEKKSLRSVMIEERMRYCTFVDMLQPLVKEECEVMSELGHLQEAMQSIALVTKDPNILPQTSEELILDAKTVMSLYPESPGGGSGSHGGCSNSLGSRKSSVCSISSMNSSGSSGSPGHHHYQRSLSQFVSPAISLKPGESSDSGFCSSPALTTQVSNAANQSHAVSTWPPHSQDVVAPPATDRPHTISTAYEKGHQRPPLTVYTFQNPETIQEGAGIHVPAVSNAGSASGQTTPSAQKSSGGTLSRPPLPVRCSSLERPLSANNNRGIHGLSQRQCPSPIPAHITKELSVYAQQHQQQQHHQQQQQLHQHQLLSSPTYVNMSELASMAAAKVSNQQQQHPQYHERHIAAASNSGLQQQQSTDSQNSIASLVSNDSITHNSQSCSILTIATPKTSTPQGHGNHSNSSASSSAPPSLHSHPSIDSTAAMPFVDQTPTPSSDCSTPQNHYSPLLSNSHSSTAVDTLSWGSSGGCGYGTKSSTPTHTVPVSDHEICIPLSTTLVSTPEDVTSAEDGLKITDTNITGNSTVPCNIEASIQNADVVSFSSADNTESPTIVENDERSRASVLQKASMFEKQAAAAAASANKNMPLLSSGSASVRSNNNNGTASAENNSAGGSNLISEMRRMDGYRAPTPVSHPQSENVAPGRANDKSFEDSIQELNNLIGELDSFQREIDGTKHQNQAKRPPQYGIQQQEQHQNIDEKSNNNNSEVRCLGEGLTIAIGTNAATTSTLTAAATTLLGYQKQQQQLDTKNSTTSSSQTNSSGCDTDVISSDPVSEDLNNLYHDNNYCNDNNYYSKNICNRTSNESEQGSSRYYVSEAGSLIDDVHDCDGFENPTFEHFTDSRSVVTGDGNISQTSEDVSITQQRNPESDNVAEDASIGSNVVVIYDHQIPITPDIDYVKKNSEIVVLRTKDPQQMQHHEQQEMRELEQLPTNLNVLDGSNVIGTQSTPITPTPHTATVQTPNQRLSSFRTNSEQQLQVLNGCTSNIHLRQQQPPLKGMHKLSTDCRNSLTLAVTIPLSPLAATAISSPPNYSTVRSKVLPLKPNLSIFRGKRNNSKNSNSYISNMLPQQSYHGPLSPVIRANFMVDLDTKIRKHKMKLHHQEHYNNIEDQHNNNQHQQQQSNVAISNCNTNRYRSALPYPFFSIPSSYSEHSHPSTSLFNPIGQQQILFSDLNSNPKLTPSFPSSSTSSPSPSPPLSCQQGKQYNLNYRQQNHSHLSSLTRSSPTQLSSFMPPMPQSLPSPPPLKLACCLPSVPISSSHSITRAAAATITTTITTTPPPPPPPPPPNITSALLTSPLPLSLSSSSSSLLSPSSSHSSISSCTAPVIAKPNVLPRPASLSGGATRIARRPSINAAKPPPPVRRSSSVTSSQNINTVGIQHLPKQQQQQVQNLICQQERSVSNSIENLPPPPAYLLLDPRQPQTSPARTRTPTPTSMPSSLPPPSPPNVIPISTSTSVKTNKLQRHLLTNTSSPCKIQSTKNRYLQQQPPPHHTRFQYQQQQKQQQQQQQQQQLTALQSLRTSSSGIYAQPKTTNNMSSFRSPSPNPNPNNVHQLHHPQAQIPSTQPKTNPNLIAQLSARLNKQTHQQHPGGESCDSGDGGQEAYNSSAIPLSNHQNEAIYVRKNGVHRHHYQHHHQSQQQQQQQQQQFDCDGYATGSNLEKNTAVGCASIRSQTKAEFLENLNAKLAKQGISGRAFAVRNLINSKALPDPRLCHESLMDQIKRGATLKRNQKINDRSAPKIR